MTKMEALKAMFEGKKVCAPNWDSEDNYLEIQGNKIVSPISNDGESVFNSWGFNDKNEWREFVPNLWTWKVGDKFMYEVDYSPSYKVLFVNKEVCFCECIDHPGYMQVYNTPQNIEKMTQI